jgi:hypothetical protein
VFGAHLIDMFKTHENNTQSIVKRDYKANTWSGYYNNQWWSGLCDGTIPSECSHFHVRNEALQTWPTSIIWQDKSTYSSLFWKGRRFDSNKSAIDLRIWKRCRFENTNVPLNLTVIWDNDVNRRQFEEWMSNRDWTSIWYIYPNVCKIAWGYIEVIWSLTRTIDFFGCSWLTAIKSTFVFEVSIVIFYYSNVQLPTDSTSFISKQSTTSIQWSWFCHFHIS